MALPEVIVVLADGPVAGNQNVLRDLIAKANYLRDKSDVGEMPCQLHALQVVYEPLVDWRRSTPEERQRFKDLIISDAQDQLDNVLRTSLDSTGRIQGNVHIRALWGSRSWETALEYAQSVGADLIMRAALESQDDHRSARVPDEWHLVRHSPVPVLLTGTQRWHQPTAIVVALDTFSTLHEPLNQRLLDEAHTMSQLLAGTIHVVSTYPQLRPFVARLGLTTEFDEQEQVLSREGEARVASALQQAEIDDAIVDVQPGDPIDAIRSVIDRLGPAIVVVGTHARTGVGKVLLGNTSEKLIHGLQTDMLVVPQHKS